MNTPRLRTGFQNSYAPTPSTHPGKDPTKLDRGYLEQAQWYYIYLGKTAMSIDANFSVQKFELHVLTEISR